MKIFTKKLLIAAVALSCSFGLFGQAVVESGPTYSKKQLAMKISVKDIRLVPEKGDEFGGGGFHLYIRKLPEVNSVLLTETTKGDDGKATNYAYRALTYNTVNGDEIRYLDGKPLVSEGAKWSLIDSTTEYTTFFGQAFHIYIPKKLKYGYDWSRNGEIEIGKGTFINIRTFEKPYADYDGEFIDNPFIFNMELPKKEPPAVVNPKIQYNSDAEETFKRLSDVLIYSEGPSTIIEDIRKILESAKDKDDLDVVFAIDTTGSMQDDMEKLKNDLLGMLEEVFAGCPNARLGLLLYRDYGDTYVYKDLPIRLYTFTSRPTVLVNNLKAVSIYGKEGGDIPEAVYEALYASADFYNWRTTATKKIILIGDAPPHPVPRGLGKYSEEYAMNAITAKNIELSVILLPFDSTEDYAK
ncbi:MAG: VWA domain-containing protein [Treponema sp.]|nr:VWA domain-containing protein [Treponema sp.]